MVSHANFRPNLNPQINFHNNFNRPMPTPTVTTESTTVSSEVIRAIYLHFPNHELRFQSVANPKTNYRDIHPSIFNHSYNHNFTKVLVPAVYDEYVKKGVPPWIYNTTIQQHLGYSVFLYQKLNASYIIISPRTEGQKAVCFYDI